MERGIEHSGAWVIALFVIVIASWFLYKYLAPKTWREWVGAGLIQGFIIALYAEMYGFPLTIYLLVRFLGIDSGYLNANLWSTLVGVGETGMMISMLFGYALLFIGFGIFFQGWRQLYHAKQENILATDGLYSLVRHPQYTGLFIALFGEGVIHWPTLFSVGLFPVIVVAYVMLARREEQNVIDEFGEEYLKYKRNVPAFLPVKGKWKQFIQRTGNSPNNPA
ncbi:MAG: isoprenylcysteine carboxyl methyltransferase [Balneola sp.]|nr:isoprenylcysteine carboxyl methyltransferase [Balneola sp.]|tara:strand:- start:13522 stop:14187 length:666 start_codon:yes stop_codon:yes gene_type:complete